ncbi:MAG: hypothetical protein EA378_05905 [Phycisphaerales bacterium]|nr:MAG: hypothetical protein EA378_05905 [Phycisphaerales bacterium]
MNWIVARAWLGLGALLLAGFASSTAAGSGRPTSDGLLDAPLNSVRRVATDTLLLVNATVHPEPGVVWAGGSVLIREGRIAAASERRLDTPAGARVVDLTGRHVYAGFVDAYVEVDAPGVGANGPGAHWNPFVTPQRDVLAGEGLSGRDRAALRRQGFAAAGLSPRGGVFRGMGAVVSLAEPASDASTGRPAVYKARAFHSLGFDRAGWRTGGYPSSHMGAIALQRQVLSDATWRRDALAQGWALPRGEAAADAASALDELARDVALVFDADHELKVLHAVDVAREAGRAAVVMASGTEFRAIGAVAEDVREAGARLIVPVAFPKAPDVSSPGAAESVELRELQTWEQAPTNAQRLVEAGVPVALTTHRLRNKGDFTSRLRRAMAHGLPGEAAHAAVTTEAAAALGVSDRLGRIAAGMAGNLVVSDAELFEPGTSAKVLDVYIDGVRHEITRSDDAFVGTWDAVLRDRFRLVFEIDERLRVTVRDGDGGEPAPAAEGEDAPEAASVDAVNVRVEGTRLRFAFDHGKLGFEEGPGAGIWSVSGELVPGEDGERRLVGTGVRGDGAGFPWRASKRAPEDEGEANGEEDEDEAFELKTVPALAGAPFGPYSREAWPEQRAVALVNATVWTSDADAERRHGAGGVIEHGVVVIENGKIAFLGTGEMFERSRPSPDWPGEVIDLEGRHITPGLVDAHSHTGLFGLGVNEGGQAVTSEVRISDALDPSAINWYRQLAGGVTTVLSLHGSANPIGGQSAIHKVRWGAQHPREMRFDNEKPGIKFALGENVKQSNWGDRFTNRYPQTRMGVETIIRDRFHAAQDYAKKWDAYNERVERIRMLRITVEEQDRRIAALERPRLDLELEPLAEILRGERLIHCHSYRQDEILMLCRVAEDFGITIGTFQHGLEVYKVAEVVREHAIGASIFSDWWAFKMEVYDGVPGAGPLQSEVGVLTSYNSDSDDVARRMHMEAAKAVRYAHPDAPVSEAEALKYVTINAAIQMGVGDRVGSIAVGKDADLVVWNTRPLSSFARPERVFVDGRELFSLERDAEDRRAIQRERARLIQKIMGGDESDRAGESPEADAEEDDGRLPLAQRMMARAYRMHALEQLRRGMDADTMLCGDCGCNVLNAAGVR